MFSNLLLLIINDLTNELGSTFLYNNFCLIIESKTVQRCFVSYGYVLTYLLFVFTLHEIVKRHVQISGKQ